MTIHSDIAAFATGWTRCRGESDGVERIGDVTIASFPRFGLVSGRTYEVLGCATRVEAMLDISRARVERGRLWLAVFAQDAAALAPFERAGFEAFRQDWLMALDQWSPSDSDPAVELLSAGDLAALPEAERRSIRSEFFEEPSFRLAAAKIDGDLAAWGRAAGGGEGTLVIDSMVTRPEFRRRGLGRRVMTRLLDSGAETGLARTILVATEDGRALYETFGFRVTRSVYCLRRA